MRELSGRAGAVAALSETKRRLLSLYLQGRAELSRTPAPGIAPRVQQEKAPLSFEQELIWLRAQEAPGLPLYNELLTVRRSGPLEVAVLERALGELLRRHQPLRTTFDREEGRAVQRIGPTPSISLPVIDLRGLPEAEREAEAARLAALEARRPFELARGPLLRFKLLRTADGEHRLLVTLHHLVHDRISASSIFLPELASLYAAFAEGRPSPLPELSLQYADYASWQRAQMPEAAWSASIEQWRRKLAGAPALLALPIDRPRPAQPSFRGSQETFQLSPALTAQLKSLGRREGTTLFVTLLSAFKVLLHRYTGEEDLLVGTPLSTRWRPEVEGLLGVFLNTVVLRTRVAESLSFRELLARVREVTLEALSAGDLPFQQLVQALAPARDGARDPLFQVNFVLEPALPAAPAGWSLAPGEVETGVARSELDLQMDDRPEGLVGHLRYQRELFLPSTIARMVEHFRVLLESLVAEPDAPLSALPMLTPAEREGPPPAAAPGGPANAFVRFEASELEQSIPERFAKQVADHPGRIAVQTEGIRWSYAELERKASRVARALAAARVADGATVALLLEPDAPMVAALLGVLAAGAAYAPLDPAQPRERLRGLLAESPPRALLTNRSNRALADALSAGTLPIFEIEAILQGPDTRERLPAGSPNRLAYFLYGSGSTGAPKCVAQNHRNVLHSVAAYTNNLHVCPEDRLTLLSPYSVDAAAVDLFAALLNGATLYPLDVRKAGLRAVAEMLRRERITLYHSTPTLFRQLARELAGGPPPPLRLVVLGGEEARSDDLESCRRLFPPDCILVNGFGPAESTVSLQGFFNAQSALEGRSLPLGYPVERTRVSLLSPEGRPGQVFGEIALHSPHLAFGHSGPANLSLFSYFADAAKGTERLYKTGDLGRLLPDGRLLFCGRRELQTKLQGLRVELGEIEAALARHPGVRASAASLWTPEAGEEGEARLLAHWVAAGEPVPSSDELRAFLRARLPGAMIPALFLRVDALPLTSGGKLDRRALPPPEKPSAERVKVAPRDRLEEQLAELWAGALKTRDFDVRDDFFALGGHSLLALGLLAELEKRLAVRVPLSLLLEAPTIERLAAALRSGAASAPARALVAIQPAGRRPPLFCVHGPFGEIFFYSALARRLGPEQPFFGLQTGDLAGPRAPQTLPELAAGYLEEIRSVQPRGPYFLGGYCLGGVIAFEMARQLTEQGEKVALLALFSGRPHKPPFLQWLRAHLGQLAILDARGRLGYLAERASRSALGVGLRVWLLRFADRIPGLRKRPARLLRDPFELQLLAGKSYRPQAYRGRLTVFFGGARENGALDAERDLAGLTAHEVEVVELPGDRESMVREPFVQVLAERLSAVLGRLDDAKPAAAASAKG